MITLCAPLHAPRGVYNRAKRHREAAMNENALNMQIRKFLKKVGVNSQREIEAALRRADAAGDLPAGAEVPLSMTLRADSIGVELVIDDALRLEE